MKFDIRVKNIKNIQSTIQLSKYINVLFFLMGVVSKLFPLKEIEMFYTSYICGFCL